MSQQNFYIRNAERGMISHVNDVHGFVTSYDDKKHLAKVTYQPSGEESGWLPIEESHIGNGWGILAGLTPGSGQGLQGGAAGAGGGSGGSSGGGGGGGGGGQGGQYQGDQVIVRFQGGQLNSGKITKRVHSQVDKPPKVKSGEILHMHALGARWHFKDDGSTHFYDKTSSQDDQNGQQSQGGQGAQGGGAGAGGGSGGPTPLKNPPPSEPQSCHFMCDGKGKSVLTHFQQAQRKSGQDEQDPNQKKSPAAYHKRSVNGKDMTTEHTSYQEDQGGGQGAQGGGAGAAGGGGSGGGQQSSQQVDPSKAPSGKDAAMFHQTKSSSKGGTHVATMFQKGGQAGSEKPLQRVSMSRDNQQLTVTHYEEGSDHKKFEMTMDGKGGKCSMTAFKDGQEMGSTTWDNQGNIGHKSKGVHSVNAQRMHINCDTHVQGGVNAAGTVTSAVGIGAPQVSGSPGSVTGISGGGKSPLE